MASLLFACCVRQVPPLLYVAFPPNKDAGKRVPKGQSCKYGFDQRMRNSLDTSGKIRNPKPLNL